MAICYPLMLHAMAIGAGSQQSYSARWWGSSQAWVWSVLSSTSWPCAINRYCYICHSLQYGLLASLVCAIPAFICSCHHGSWPFWLSYPTCTLAPSSMILLPYTCIFNYVNNPAFAVTTSASTLSFLCSVGFCYVKIWTKCWQPMGLLDRVRTASLLRFEIF